MRVKLIIFLIIFPFIGNSQNLKIEKINNAALMCKPYPEGVSFGLWFEQGQVTQFGIENFNVVIDYKVSFEINKKNVDWLRLRLRLDDLRLELGDMKNHIAECKRTDSLKALLLKLKEVINLEMQKNTI